MLIEKIEEKINNQGCDSCGGGSGTGSASGASSSTDAGDNQSRDLARDLIKELANTEDGREILGGRNGGA